MECHLLPLRSVKCHVSSLLCGSSLYGIVLEFFGLVAAMYQTSNITLPLPKGDSKCKVCVCVYVFSLAVLFSQHTQRLLGPGSETWTSQETRRPVHV